MVARSVIHVALLQSGGLELLEMEHTTLLLLKILGKLQNSPFVENTTAPRFEKGKVIVSSSGNEVSVRSCWADGCDSSNRKLDIIVTD